MCEQMRGTTLALRPFVPQQRWRECCQEAKRAHVAVIRLYTPRLLDSQTNQALDDMLQALVMEERSPNMIILQKFVEVGGRGNQDPALVLVVCAG